MMEGAPGNLPPEEPQTPEDNGPSRDECVMGLIAHALGISSSFLGPLLIWLTKGKESAYVSHHATEALNLQIVLAAILLACWNFAPDEWFALLLSAFLAVNTILSVPAIIAASKGKPYRYWLPVRLIG